MHTFIRRKRPYPHIFAESKQCSALRYEKIVFIITATLMALGIQSNVNSQTLVVCSSSNRNAPNGMFAKPIRVEMLDNGRSLKLLETVRYIDPCGENWDAPVGSIVDGASIPRIAWSIIGGPFEGKYRDASVIHDIACDSRSRPWKMVHEVFYFAMLANDTPRWKAKAMYAAVYHFGPRWRDPITAQAPDKSELREEDFNALVENIKKRERASAAVGLPPISLEEIERWKPNLGGPK